MHLMYSWIINIKFLTLLVFWQIRHVQKRSQKRLNKLTANVTDVGNCFTKTQVLDIELCRIAYFNISIKVQLSICKHDGCTVNIAIISWFKYLMFIILFITSNSAKSRNARNIVYLWSLILVITEQESAVLFWTS